MGEIVKTKYADSEVSKVQDFAHTANSPVEILNAVLEGAFDDVVNSFVVSGLSVRQLSTPSMNVELAPGLAFDRASDKLIHLASAVSVPVTAAHATLDRIDTIEVRYKETGFDSETRAFKDPVNGTVSFAAVETKTKVSLEARCLAGSPGAVAAPTTEAGWVKLAEVFVGAAAGAIFDANIRNMTAEKDATDNSAWTVEKQKTFHLGSIESIKDLILSHAAEVATQAVAVHGVRQGHANGFDSDTVDGKHASEFIASSFTSQTINKDNSLNTIIADMEIGEFKTITKTGTGDGPISTPSGNMFVYRSSLGAGVCGSGATVWAAATTGTIYVMRLA